MERENKTCVISSSVQLTDDIRRQDNSTLGEWVHAKLWRVEVRRTVSVCELVPLKSSK